MSVMLQALNTKSIEMAGMNNSLTKIPAEVSKFTQYTSWDLSANMITSIPVGIFDKLQNTVQIGLKSNLIASIPAGAFNLPLATSDIQVLLSGNPISSISPGFFQGTVHFFTSVSERMKKSFKTLLFFL